MSCKNHVISTPLHARDNIVRPTTVVGVVRMPCVVLDYILEFGVRATVSIIAIPFWTDKSGSKVCLIIILKNHLLQVFSKTIYIMFMIGSSNSHLSFILITYILFDFCFYKLDNSKVQISSMKALWNNQFATFHLPKQQSIGGFSTYWQIYYPNDNFYTIYFVIWFTTQF